MSRVLVIDDETVVGTILRPVSTVTTAGVATR